MMAQDVFHQIDPHSLVLVAALARHVEEVCPAERVRFVRAVTRISTTFGTSLT
jgi:hypothetical protein